MADRSSEIGARTGGRRLWNAAGSGAPRRFSQPGSRGRGQRKPSCGRRGWSVSFSHRFRKRCRRCALPPHSKIARRCSIAKLPTAIYSAFSPLCVSAVASTFRPATSHRVRKRIWGLAGTKPSTETRSPILNLRFLFPVAAAGRRRMIRMWKGLRGFIGVARPQSSLPVRFWCGGKRSATSLCSTSAHEPGQ